MCGLSGAAVAASGSGLPLVFFVNGQPSSTVMTPTSATYPAGLSVGVSATPWASSPSGCSLRVASAAVTDGNAGVTWKVPKALLQPAIDANAFTIEAKVFPEVWRVGYSKWNADVFGSQCNWDSAFKVSKHSACCFCIMLYRKDVCMYKNQARRPLGRIPEHSVENRGPHLVQHSSHRACPLHSDDFTTRPEPCLGC